MRNEIRGWFLSVQLLLQSGNYIICAIHNDLALSHKETRLNSLLIH